MYSKSSGNEWSYTEVTLHVIGFYKISEIVLLDILGAKFLLFFP